MSKAFPVAMKHKHNGKPPGKANTCMGNTKKQFVATTITPHPLLS
jgi:hypothetical protein